MSSDGKKETESLDPAVLKANEDRSYKIKGEIYHFTGWFTVNCKKFVLFVRERKTFKLCLRLKSARVLHKICSSKA